MEKILTVRDVADLLQVKEITVREMFRAGRLRGFKMGKAWRTTEDMLRADIETLAAGGTPGEGEAPAPKTAKKPRTKRVTKGARKQNKQAAAPEPASADPPPAEAAPDMPDRDDPDDPDEEDDAQGLLF